MSSQQRASGFSLAENCSLPGLSSRLALWAPEHFRLTLPAYGIGITIAPGITAMFRTSLDQSSQEHQEGVRLARMCRHFPMAGLVIVGFALLNLASAVASILAISPANIMP